ncbi:MAG TPA: YfhO family protein [Thermoanaerobaculia bacterium]|nr:YfhO family protein [Thermoanaerobaculia bacterium]
MHSAFRRHGFPLALIAALPAILFLPALFKREVFTLRDHFDYFQPLRWFTAMELKAGRLPLWNPYSASGEPWLANPQTGVFYPPQWLFVVLPFETAYMLFLLLHLMILGGGAYLLFSRRASQGAALLGAVALMFSGPVLSLLDVSNNLATLAWIPLALWCAAEGAWRRGGIVLALAFLGGEPFFAALAALLYVVVRRHRDVLLTGLVAFGLSAVQLIPFLEYAATSDRAAGMEDALILRDSMPLRDWPRIAIPPTFEAQSYDAQLGQHFIPVIYMGMVVVALAAVGLTTIRRRRDTPGWIALLLFSAAVAAGPALLTQLPVTLFRYPARLVPIAAIAVAALAVAGWERVRSQRRWVDLVLVLIVVADLLPRSATLFNTAPFRTDVVPYGKEIGIAGKVLRFGQIDVARRAAWMAGYLNLYDRRFDAFTAAPLVSEGYVRLHRQLLENPRFDSFAYAGIVHIITRYDLPKPWFPVVRTGDIYVFLNLDAFPMAAHFTPGSKSLRRGAWEVDTSRAKVTIQAAHDGVLVLRQQAARGWRVSIDGKPAEALLIDGIFRGVTVPSGRHEVVWEYRPPSLLIGALVTFFTLVTLQISRFVKRTRTIGESKNFSSCPSNSE